MKKTSQKEKILKEIDKEIINGNEETWAAKSNNNYLKAIAIGIRYLISK